MQTVASDILGTAKAGRPAQLAIWVPRCPSMRCWCMRATVSSAMPRPAHLTHKHQPRERMRCARCSRSSAGAVGCHAGSVNCKMPCCIPALLKLRTQGTRKKSQILLISGQKRPLRYRIPTKLLRMHCCLDTPTTSPGTTRSTTCHRCTQIASVKRKAVAPFCQVPCPALAR